MQNTIILLDWSKWSWKTSVSKEIIKQAKKYIKKDFVVISLDNIRRNLKLKATSENNEIAFQKLLASMKEQSENWKNIIIDCGLVEDKLKRLEESIDNINDDTVLYKFFLDGDYQELENRVKERDKQDNKEFNPETFKKVYYLIRNKSFDWYKKFDTWKLSSEKIATQIVQSLLNWS